MKCKNCNNECEWHKDAPAKLKKTGFCSMCISKPFEITSVSRADLLDRFTPAQVAKFDDRDMARLASKMADAYCENGFWDDLVIIGEHLLEDKI